jgi:hypothetical protein
VFPDGMSTYFTLGPHPPRLWPEDIELVHDMWLTLSSPEIAGAKLHHRDVVGVALRRMKKDLESNAPQEVIADLNTELEFRKWSEASAIPNETRTLTES